MRTLDIGVDVDNVIYPWTTVYTRWVEHQKALTAGTLDDIPHTGWHWYRDQWGMSDEEFMEHYVSGVEAGVIWRVGDPPSGALATLRRLHNAGHRLHYVTNRKIPGVSLDYAHAATTWWLGVYGFPADSITVSADKGAVPTDVFLDDSPENVRALLLAGHKHPLLWDAPHNQRDRVCEDWRCAIRVHSWPGFERVIAAVSTLPSTQRTP